MQSNTYAGRIYHWDPEVVLVQLVTQPRGSRVSIVENIDDPDSPRHSFVLTAEVGSNLFPLSKNAGLLIPLFEEQLGGGRSRIWEPSRVRCPDLQYNGCPTFVAYVSGYTDSYS